MTLEQLQTDLREAFANKDEEQFESTLVELTKLFDTVGCEHEFISKRIPGQEQWQASCSKCGVDYKGFLEKFEKPVVEYR